MRQILLLLSVVAALALSVPAAGLAAGKPSFPTISFTCTDGSGTATYDISIGTYSYQLSVTGSCIAPSGTFTSVQQLLAWLKANG